MPYMGDTWPTFSPDGKSLLFVRASDGGSRFDTADVFGRYDLIVGPTLSALPVVGSPSS